MSTVPWLEILGWSQEEINDLRFLGFSYVKQGHYKTALKFFDALSVLCPDSAYDTQTLGAIHLQLGDNLTALNLLDKALVLEPNHNPTQLNRAKALFLLGYHKQGISQAEELLSSHDSYVSGQAEALILAYS